MKRFTFDRSAMALTVLLGAASLVYFWTPTDFDLWWHLRTGRVILESGVPDRDIFSFTADGNLWIAHSWLAEVVMYAIQSTAGYGLLVACFAAINAATYLLTYYITRRAGAGPALAVALLAVRLLIDAPAWGVRTQMLTNLYFTIFLAVLLMYRQGAAGRVDAESANGVAAWIGPHRKLWLLPPLMLLWANTHAGFTVGLILLALWFGGEAANALLGWREAPPLRPLFAVGVVSGLITLINPYGLTLLTYPLFFLGGPQSSTLTRYIQEWQPIDARSAQHAPFLFTLAALLMLALLRPAASTPVDAALAGGAGAERQRSGRLAGAVPFTGDAVLLFALALFLVMAMQAMRLQPQWAAMWALALAGGLPRLWPALGRDRALDTPPLRTRLNLLLAAGTLLALAAVLLTAPRAQTGPAPLETGYPVEALSYLREHPDRGADPLLNEWAWGGYLIARRWPEHKVFIDGRADPFRGQVLEDYVAAIAGEPAWREIFARYGVRGALIHRDSALARTLEGAAGWRRVCCENGPAALFVAR